MAGFFNLGLPTKKIEQSKKFAEQQFQAIESLLGGALSSYQVYVYHLEGFWNPSDYEETKQSVFDSHIIQYDEKRSIADIGSRVAFLIDEQEKILYLNITRRHKDPEQIDWAGIKKFEDWATTETKVDRAIETHRLKRKMERQGKPAPKWWQFWLIR